MAETKTRAPTITSLRKYVRLDKEKRELDIKVKKVAAELKESADLVLDYFQRHGMNQFKVDGITVYMARELWAGREDDVSHEQACAALEEAGLGDYAGPRINSQSLSAHIRELDAAGDPLPPPLVGVIKVSEVFKIKTRKSS